MLLSHEELDDFQKASLTMCHHYLYLLRNNPDEKEILWICDRIIRHMTRHYASRNGCVRSQWRDELMSEILKLTGKVDKTQF